MFAWVARFIEKHAFVHRAALSVWRSFPPRVAGMLKGVLATKWVIGGVGVMLDEDVSPPEVLLVEHSYRPRGAWGLPGGALESIPGSPTARHQEASPDDVLEAAMRREVWEELGLDLVDVRGLRVDAVPYVAEEPGPYRLNFYFKCVPRIGFPALRAGLASGEIKPRSPEVTQMRLVPLADLAKYELFSTDTRFLRDDLPRLRPALAGMAQSAPVVPPKAPGLPER